MTRVKICIMCKKNPTEKGYTPFCLDCFLHHDDAQLVACKGRHQRLMKNLRKLEEKQAKFKPEVGGET